MKIRKFESGIYQKGLYLILATALISGISVFFNKFALANFGNSDIFTFLKNGLVAIFFIAGIGLISKFREFRKLERKDWLLLVAIGLIGGSIPFLLFFKGLTISSAASSAIIHKSLFVWVSILAVVFLKEKLGKVQIFALILLLLGNTLILGLPKSFAIGRGEILIFIATLFWAVENVIAKIALKKLSGEMVAFGRMFFGSVIILFYLILTGKAAGMFSLNGQSWLFLIISSAFLFGFVLTYYKGLKLLPASVAASVLVIASPITSILTAILVTHKISGSVVFGSILVLIGILSLRGRLGDRSSLGEIASSTPQGGISSQ